ncbi:MAG: ABC transporter ATP-binding protein [Planctomycetes bacterium]|nr:ABC transporter ATP-binding protein [Planctomycetota bacterium]
MVEGNGSAPVPADAAAISIQGLTKRYGRLTAVRDLHLTVAPGEIFGFLGLNGAGKTTTIRTLLDLLRPTAGHVRVLGHDCQREGLRVRSKVGYLPGEMGLYGDMTGRAVLAVLARLGGATVSPEYRAELEERLELPASDLDRRLREYSTGMKRKLGIIQAFQADPPLLVLDEPTEGLDPLMQQAFYDLLFDTRRRGRTIFMSSHVLSEVERVCDRIALMRKGELVLLSPVEDVRRLAPRRVEVTFTTPIEKRPEGLPPGYEVLETRDGAWRLRAQGPLGPLVTALAGLPVADLLVEEPRLEDVLLRFYREGAP